jgi:acetyl-CoA carboxylase beta subunit
VGANSQQGVALLVFFVSFTLASMGMLYGANIVLLLLAAVTFAASVGMFLKAKPLEESR